MAERTATGTVSGAETRAQLEKILAGQTFARAVRLSRLLRYLVGHSIGNDAEFIKEYTLGVEVFDRGESFDPRSDTIVRVQARRLRARLARYYETEGRGDRCVIEVPRAGISLSSIFASRCPSRPCRRNGAATPKRIGWSSRGGSW